MAKKQRAKRIKKHRGIFGIVLASLSACVSASLIVIMALTACDYINLIPEYVTVSFYGDGGELLDKQEVLEFSSVEYAGRIPTKDPDSEGPFMFYGWDRLLGMVWHDMSVHALFTRPPDLSGLDLSGIGDLDLDIPKTPVMKIKSQTPGLTYLRQRSYGDYNHGKWMDAPSYSGKYLTPLSDTFTNPLNYAGNIACTKTSAISNDIEITYLKDFPYTPIPEFAKGPIKTTDSDAFVRNLYMKDQTVNFRSAFIEPIHFPNMVNTLRNANIGNDAKKEIKNYKRFAKDNYYKVEDDVYDLIKSLVKDNRIKSNDNNVYANVSNAINKKIKLNILSSGKRNPGSDPLLNAFQSTGQGNQSIFATAATLMFRYLGIPARYCTGYLGAIGPNDVGKETNVYNLQVSAWAEVFVDNVGWLVVDPCIDAILGQIKDGKKPGSGPMDGGSIIIGGDINQEATFTSKVYDAQPFRAEEVVKIDDKTKQTLDDLNLTARFESPGLEDFVDVGTRAFSFSTRLFNDKGEDVTKDYDIEQPDLVAVLNIRQRPLKIKIESKEAIYDGNPISSTFTSNGLISGHELEVSIAMFTDPGEHEVTADLSTLRIIDYNSSMFQNLASNYDISVQNGTLIIYEEDIEE